MFPICFDYIFVHLRQEVRLKPEIFVNFRPGPGPNPTRKARLKPDPKSPARLTTPIPTNQ